MGTRAITLPDVHGQDPPRLSATRHNPSRPPRAVTWADSPPTVGFPPTALPTRTRTPAPWRIWRRVGPGRPGLRSPAHPCGHSRLIRGGHRPYRGARPPVRLSARVAP